MKLHTLKFSDCSKFRNELMGICIISVLCGHTIGWAQVESGPVYCFLNFISRLLHTSIFLFLSAFGLTYSLYRNPDILAFYKRRAFRLILPFILIMGPYYLCWDFLLYPERGLLHFIADITALTFWLYENDGMWYISISIVLYAFFPILYRASKFIGHLPIILMFIMLSLTLCKFTPPYYEQIAIGIDKIPVFCLGGYCGRLSLQEKETNIIALVLSIMLSYCIVKYISTFHIPVFQEIAGMCERLFYLPFCIILCKFCSTSNKQILNTVNKMLAWFGVHSLEIYLLHFVVKRFIFYAFDYSPALLTIVSITITIGICTPIHSLTSRSISNSR